MPFEPTPHTNITLVSLAELTKFGKWRLSLAHTRDHHLLIWTTRGQGVAMLDGATRGVGAHNVLFIPAGSLMSYEMSRLGFAQALIIPASCSVMVPNEPHHLRILDLNDQAELGQLIEAMGREQATPMALSQIAMASYAQLSVIWLRRQIILEKENNQVPPDSSARILSRAYCTYLVRHLPNSRAGVDSKSHAAALGVSATHLARVCRSETGRTAARLLIERQLHAAHKLLIETNVSISNIAQHLGFDSDAYFSRFIKAQTGMPPSVLRQVAKSNRPVAES